MANLGFVGLGVMGGNMVDRLIKKGHTVTGYNRTRAKAQWLIDRGMRWADTPRQVAEGTDVTFAMVTNSAAVTAVMEGPNGIVGGLKPGQLLIDMLRPGLQPEIAGKFRQGDIRHCYADISKARRLLGYEPKVSFEQGLADLVEWVRRQHAEDRFAAAAQELERRGLTR